MGLAHRRLAIQDLSERGAQPFVSGNGRYVISFNGEIYNYRALRTELEAKGERFRSDPVIVHFWERDVVIFQVYDYMNGDSLRGEFTGSIPGVVRPNFPWITAAQNQKTE